MAINFLKLSTMLLHLTARLLLCPDDIKTTDMKVMEICIAGPCGIGKRFEPNNSTCTPCGKDTFMDQRYHQCIQCISCTKANEFEHELVIRNCTAINDTEIGCDGLHYKNMRDGFREPYCDRCAECSEGQRVEQKCGPDSDTVCVNEILDTTNDKDGYLIVTGSSPHSVDKSSSTSVGNAVFSFRGDNFSNHRALITTVIVVSVGIFVCFIFIILFMYRKRNICKASTNLLYHRMSDGGGQTEVSYKRTSGVFITRKI